MQCNVLNEMQCDAWNVINTMQWIHYNDCNIMNAMQCIEYKWINAFYEDNVLNVIL